MRHSITILALTLGLCGFGASTAIAGGIGGGGTGGTDSNRCVEACDDLWTCTQRGTHCPGLQPGDQATFVAGCFDTCLQNMAIAAVVDVDDCDGTIAVLQAANQSFADVCADGYGGGGPGGADAAGGTSATGGTSAPGGTGGTVNPTGGGVSPGEGSTDGGAGATNAFTDDESGFVVVDGCGCTTPGGTAPAIPWTVLAGFALLALRRRINSTAR